MKIFVWSGLSRQTFAEKLGISNAVLSHISSGRNKASLDLVISLLKHFPEISIEWLLLNKGEMIRDNGHSLKMIKKEMTLHVDAMKQTNELFSKQLGLLENQLNELKQ